GARAPRPLPDAGETPARPDTPPPSAGMIVGYVVAAALPGDANAFLRTLVVDHKHRRKGIAGRLLAAAERSAGAAGGAAVSAAERRDDRRVRRRRRVAWGCQRLPAHAGSGPQAPAQRDRRPAAGGGAALGRGARRGRIDGRRAGAQLPRAALAAEGRLHVLRL